MPFMHFLKSRFIALYDMFLFEVCLVYEMFCVNQKKKLTGLEGLLK